MKKSAKILAKMRLYFFLANFYEKFGFFAGVGSIWIWIWIQDPFTSLLII